MNIGMNPTSFTTSTASWKSGDGVPDQFPAGLRVLVVDDDPTCLKILEKMLRNCLYEVTKCSRAELALKLLRDNKDGFDIVISDVHMPDMDGFKLLEHVGLEMDLPVIMMSADDSKNIVMKGVTHGACDYLIKPVRMEALKNIWQHVVRKKKYEWKENDFEHSGSLEDGGRQQRASEDVDYSSSANEGTSKCSRKRRDEEDEVEERDDPSTLKKPRVVWSVELHQQFVNAVNQLGIDKAVPKKILELMNVPGLTRENVASHLQKYRLYLRRLSGQHQNGLGNSFLGSGDATFGPMATLNGLDLQALASSGQLPPQSLATIQAAALARPANKSTVSMPQVDRRNIFSFESPKIRFMEGQQQQLNNSSKQVNLLHGIPTNMDSKQLAALHQSSNSFACMNMHVHSQSSQTSSLLTPMVQSQSRTPIINEISSSLPLNVPSSVGEPVLSQAIPITVLGRNGVENVNGPTHAPVSLSCTLGFSRSQLPEFPGNNFPLLSNSGITPLVSKGLLQEGLTSEIKGPRSSIPNCDVFNELNQKSAEDWGFESMGPAFDASQHLNMPSRLDMAPSVLVQPGFFSDPKNGNMEVQSLNKIAFSAAEGLGNTTNLGQQLTSNQFDNSLRIKSERLPDMSFENNLFADQFGQDELISAFFMQHQEGKLEVDNELSFDGYHLDNLPV